MNQDTKKYKNERGINVKQIKYFLSVITVLTLTGCSISDIEMQLEMNELDKIIILSCLGVIAGATLIIIIILLTKLGNKKKIELDEEIDNNENNKLDEESNK